MDRNHNGSGGRDPWNNNNPPQRRPSQEGQQPNRSLGMMAAIPRRPRPLPPPQPSASATPNGPPSRPPPSLTAAIPRRNSNKGPSSMMSSTDTIPRRNSVDPIPRRNSFEGNRGGGGGPRDHLHYRDHHRDHHHHHQRQPQHHRDHRDNRPDNRHPQHHQQHHQRPRVSAPPSSSSSRQPSRPLPSASTLPPPSVRYTPIRVGGGITIESEKPFIIRIPLKGVDLDHEEGIRRHRQSTRTPKRQRPTYEELRDTDSDDYMTDSDDERRKSKKDSKKGRRLVKSSGASSLAPSTSPAVAAGIADDGLPAPSLELKSSLVEAPPPGTLNSLWYSRECFLHVFVMEKILAWKTRPVTQLEWVPENFPPGLSPPPVLPSIDPAEAIRLLNLALTKGSFWRDQRKRMEASRLLPQQCPVVLSMAAAKEYKDTDGKPKFRVRQHVPDENGKHQREEVFLVKWRGRCHLHASWERRTDIVKYDQSNNTARHKLRRFVQNQELSFGMNWKQVLEEERATAAAIHAHGGQAALSDNMNPAVTTGEDQLEEFFPPACTEVERILACDESEMDLKLFARQRALNRRAEQEDLRQKELPEAQLEKWNSQTGLESLLEEVPWDPEDNVRYVVKWKGLPFAEMTWEYWRDIKQDAVDEAEDFWHRQQPPGPDEIMATSQPHPHMRDFRKLQESPSFGNSVRPRPVAKLEDDPATASDEDEAEISLKLRSYQLEGVNWLLFNYWNKRSCILADEMGLGKTIQSMCFLKTLQDHSATRVRGPFLIVAPLSLINQWQAEARSWAPDLNVVLYHGSADARDFLVKQEFYYSEQFMPKANAIKLKKQHITKFHILITTYEVVLKDVNVISKVKWRALIVDEAHRLKNPKSRLFEELATVPRDYCVLLTGTPLANATEELWALLHFADPVSFKDKEGFLEKFGQLTDADQVNDLHTLLKPYLLRRVKEDVEKSLPPKEETILEVTLTPIQKKYYKAIYERNTAFLYKGSKPSNAPSLMNVMMELRKCCNHPYLVRGAEERILADAANQVKDAKDAEGNPAPLDYTQLFGEQLVKSSGKMVLLGKLLPKLFSNGHKVLIFSQMVRVLDLIEELLRIKKYRYERLDGSTSSSARSSAVERFTRKSCQRFVMLLSTRAGGLGLNLTAADIVIIFDSDWNPQNDLQAMARAHRIGQTRAVSVYRLLTAKTYEMHMFHSASMKLGLERAVLSQQREQGEEGEDGKPKAKSDREAQAKEIDELLKKGAYDVFRDDDDGEAEKFMETDIDQLLERSARTVTYDPKESQGLSGGLGSFSKASFVADTGDGEKDVDLDDPDFWSKAIGLEVPVETPEEIAQMLDDGVKRSRKQVQVFDPYAEFAEIEQKKRDKIAQKLKEEKDEKERLRREKKKRKLDDKERKRKEREELRGSLFGKSAIPPPVEEEEPPEKKKVVKEPKVKKTSKGADRKRALRRAHNADPVLERLKQAWDVTQRNRAIAAALRFGFTRFCKIRNESNLTSLPIQDLEVFSRSYFFQLALQVAVSLLEKMGFKGDNFRDEHLPLFLTECLGHSNRRELDWICDCVSSAMKKYKEVELGRRFLRMPLALAEGNFVVELRKGPALRALRRFFMLSRLQRFIEDCLDEILSALGYEELGKRGCQTSDLTAIDADLKSRLVTTEELSLSVSAFLRKMPPRTPSLWWDRSCDVALLVGSFIHGLGNYEAMQNDDALPFPFRIRKFSVSDEASVAAQRRFHYAAAASKRVFDDALETAKAKAQEEVQAAVAAAAAASSEREKDALALREGGAAADAVLSNMPEPASDKLYEVDVDDSHFVTLPRLQKMLVTSIRSASSLVDLPLDNETGVAGGCVVIEGKDGESGKRKGSFQQNLAMPDARVLDHRLSILLVEVERNAYPDEAIESKKDTGLPTPTIWPGSEEVAVISKIRSKAIAFVLGDSIENQDDLRCEYKGIGVNGSQCGASHRSLDDGTDFSVGAASAELSQVAYGSEAPRYLRAIGVPMNLTRFALAALAYADEKCVDRMLSGESLRNGKHPETHGHSNVNSNANTTAGDNTDSKADAVGSSSSKGPDAVTSTTTIPKEGNASLVPKVFENSAILRTSVCVVVLHFGVPFVEDSAARVNKSLWMGIREQCGALGDVQPGMLFNAEHFRTLVKEIVASASDGGAVVEIPDAETITDYIESYLLPHCLRLCVMGNGPSTRNARGSKGEYDTAFGVSLYPEHASKRQSPLPDPCLPLGDQSLEALACASAILRRVRLMRTTFSIASGKLSKDKLDEILRSSFMRKSMTGLPIWWCPWIHDAALLLHASTRGLFAVLRDRRSAELEEEHQSAAFSHKTIVQHMYSTFAVEENALPRSVVEESPPDDVTAWIEIHAKQFPTANVLERRLAFLCAKATELVDCGIRYDNLPMFDHGGWPRN